MDLIVFLRIVDINQIYLATIQVSINRSTGKPTRSLVKPLTTLKSVHSTNAPPALPWT